MPLIDASKYGVMWTKCVSLELDNTSVDVRRYNSVIAEARKKNSLVLMGSTCRIADDTAKWPRMYSLILQIFIFTLTTCPNEKILIKLFPILQSYCLFLITNEKDGMKSAARKNSY